MSPIPRVTESTRERVAREFDQLGPDACMAKIMGDLEQHNPEVLDMMSKCAADFGNSTKIMQGLGMFYRLLVVQLRTDVGESLLNLPPRVTPDTRDLIVRQIDANGSEAFTMESIADLEATNPELLQTAHNFASRHRDYLGVMQGFALLYKSLVLQSFADRAFLQ